MISEINIQNWHVVTFCIVAIGGAVLKWWETVHRERAKERREDTREKKEELRANEQTDCLKDIAKSNNATSVNIATLNERLLGERELHKQMHSENLSRMETICKAACSNFKPKEKTS